MEVIRLSLGTVNAFLIRDGQKYMLVDTGIPGAQKSILKQLAKLGVDAHDIEYLFLTHGHYDHIANAAFFQREYGMRVAIAAADVELIENPHGQPFTYAEGIGKLIRMLPSVSKFEQFTPDIILTEDEIHDFGFGETIHFVPGHSNGSVAIELPDGDFIAGDLFFNFFRPHRSYMANDKSALDSSIEQALRLPIKTIYPGHGSPFPINKYKD